ncbi:uncharacterized protein MONOS_13514 [Monocercomonoides exilis]|uniref:uncharacterized protein n=1 Tax=Monocercomonoides exilis TaxID=2049356 RepID=UPI00355A1672|nr:hypothetical protein MONOS_13514 [Monocercomonoides exilis]|eukprot:MONOS_13514.1-p1 / transcript=MONOS_13514.1 / gene=MONOS_13514 / organism=Monocercomonoides_exilis_PA203 / gene_product=unspecified product / transcript_product=unspecified product / location=Mono_scaffold00838:23804-24385(-) / protein_length=147 / sequence_SO=supercontig / SO=protein_coding / is_pseudo=false
MHLQFHVLEKSQESFPLQLGCHALATESAAPVILLKCCSAVKQMVLEIAWQTLSPTDAHVVFEIGRGEETTAMHFLEQMPICEVGAPMQSIVLRNEGGTSIDNRLELSDVKRLNASATYFPLFECSITRGIVPAIKRRQYIGASIH